MVQPLLAVSMGCPGGVGAEVALAALARSREGYDAALFGDVELARERAVHVRVAADRVVRIERAADARTLPAGSIGVVQVGAPLSAEARAPGISSREGGRAQLAWIDAACDAVVFAEADALVTAPVSKSAIASSGARDGAGFLGHTEYLGARLRAAETVMAFVADALTISLASTHLPLSAVAATITPDHVARAAYWTVRLVDALDRAPRTAPAVPAAIATTNEQRAPRPDDPPLPVAVLALNPHAGEDGLLGSEERMVIAPGIAHARERLRRDGRTRALLGPLPAESAIRRAVHERAYAACVAIYHDQATIPSKLTAFGDAVNVTLGLPIVRTSVDHGTAYDIAGTGRADARGMSAALTLAARLVDRSDDIFGDIRARSSL